MTAFVPVITSLLDNDLYKFTMWQAMLHRFPQTTAEYAFLCRDEPQYPLADLLDEVNAQLDHLCTLRFTEDELAYLGSLRFIKSDFVDFLRLFQFQRRFIRAWVEDGQLCIRAAGPQVHVMNFEIHVLSTVNELYFRRFDQARALEVGRERLRAKIDLLRAVDVAPARAHPLEIFDFGVRRRFSGAWQREVVATLRDEVPEFFNGHVERAAREGPGAGADRHHGARIPADLPGAGGAAARFPACRAGGLGAGIPRRPGHRAHRRGHDGRLPGRLRPVLRQAVRRAAAGLGRPDRLGREGDRALREAAHRPAHQAAGVLGRAGHPEGAGDLRRVRRPRAHRLRHRHQLHQRRGPARRSAS